MARSYDLRERGSASVEFAAVLPLVAISMLIVVQVALVAWDQLRIAHAAREGARVLSTTNDASQARQAALDAGNLDSSRTQIDVTPSDRPVDTPATVTIRYTPSIVVPFVGRFVPPFTLSASVTMRTERDPP